MGCSLSWMVGAAVRRRAAVETRSAPEQPPRAVPPSGARLLAHLERLDEIALADVVEAAQSDTALEALADLRGIVLEATQRFDREVVAHDHTLSRETRLGVPLDRPVLDHEIGRAHV